MLGSCILNRGVLTYGCLWTLHRNSPMELTWDHVNYGRDGGGGGPRDLDETYMYAKFELH